MTRYRKRYTAEEKVAIIRRHLVEKVTVPDICQELGLNPNVFYRWQKEFFENGAKALERSGSGPSAARDRETAALKNKLARKDEVIAELMEEHVALKKKFGGL
jgi:transposase-like protein